MTAQFNKEIYFTSLSIFFCLYEFVICCLIKFVSISRYKFAVNKIHTSDW